MKKLLFFVFIAISSVSAQVVRAEDKASTPVPPVAFQHNGFTGYDDGFMTLDGDDYDPTDPQAGAMLQYMEDIGEIERVPEPLLKEAAGTSCGLAMFVKVVISEQRLYIYENCSSSPSYVWKTSTGLKKPTPKFDTYPSGRFGKITNMSGKYPGSCTINGVRYGNMSYATYLAANENYAIHGGCEEELLGTPRSHGCIRIARANAQLFQGMVKAAAAKSGYRSVRIQIIK